MPVLHMQIQCLVPKNRNERKPNTDEQIRKMKSKELTGGGVNIQMRSSSQDGEQELLLAIWRRGRSAAGAGKQKR